MTMIQYKMSLTTFVLLMITIVVGQDVTFRINEGLIGGKYMTTKNGEQFSGFIGIPYAEAPVGRLRFKPPVPKSPWSGLRKSLDKVNICPQIDLFTNQTLIQGDEDCLYLNVFTPKLTNFPNLHLKPVMLFIHGGGYTIGHANAYQPEILLDHNIVLVVINYRLGALGFFTTGDMIVPGNNGLKDQNLALKWTKNNIKAFGGDPNRITIFGQSCGGASVHMHMMSPLSRGLFKGGISQSGTALALWNFGQRNEAIAICKKLAESFGCSSKNNVEMVECLRQKNAYDFIEKNAQFVKWVNDPIAIFKPIAENNHPGAFLTQHPVHYIKSGNIAKVPWITGLTTDEGSLQTSILMANPPLLEQFEDNFMSITPSALGYENFVADVNATTKKLKEYYFKDGISGDTAQNITDLYTDGWMFSTADASIRLHLKYVKNPIYYFRFSYRGRNSFTQIFSNSNVDYGVAHFDELLYLFSMADQFFAGNYSQTDKKMASVLPKLWHNFARLGKPTRFWDAVDWRVVTSNDAMQYLDIEGPNDLNLKTGLFLDRARLWRPIIDEILNSV